MNKKTYVAYIRTTTWEHYSHKGNGEINKNRLQKNYCPYLILILKWHWHFGIEHFDCWKINVLWEDALYNAAHFNDLEKVTLVG